MLAISYPDDTPTKLTVWILIQLTLALRIQPLQIKFPCKPDIAFDGL